MTDSQRAPSFQRLVADDPPTVLFAERLRDGRVALGSRTRTGNEEWEPGELHILEPSAYLDLAGWLAGPVEDAWRTTVRDRQEETLRTATELYGDDPDAVSRLTEQVLREVPPGLLARAFILLANSIGPEARERLVERLNHTSDPSEDAELRRRLAEEHEAIAYTVAAAALLDALANGVSTDG